MSNSEYKIEINFLLHEKLELRIFKPKIELLDILIQNYLNLYVSWPSAVVRCIILPP
jgi:hypothetical protein